MLFESEAWTEILKAVAEIKTPVSVAAVSVIVLVVLFRSVGSKPTARLSRLLAFSLILLGFIAVIPFLATAYLEIQKNALEARSIFRVRVTVADEAGLPVENARIWANVDAVAKKVDGGWELDVPARTIAASGEMTVMAEDKDTASSGRTTVKLGSDEQVAVTLVLVPDSAEIRGAAVDEDQNAISGVRVNVVGYSEEGMDTDRDGGFKLKSHVGKNQQVRLHFEKQSFRSVEDYYPAGQRAITVTLQRIAQ